MEVSHGVFGSFSWKFFLEVSFGSFSWKFLMEVSDGSFSWKFLKRPGTYSISL